MATAAGFENVANISQEFTDRPKILVLSALGKTTNHLETVVAKLFEEGSESAQSRLDEIIEHHIAIARDLELDGNSIVIFMRELRNQLAEIKKLDWDKAYDNVVCVGELTSTRMLVALMEKRGVEVQWIDARKVVHTNDIHRGATVNWAKTEATIDSMVKPMLKNNATIVTQGFIGGHNGAITTLGREGSDYSAAIFAYCLNADSLTIWKDVKGVLTADPREFEGAVKIDRLSYREAIEMTYYGAKVIHPKTIKPLQNKGIELIVRSFINREDVGTRIVQEVEISYPPIVVIEKDQCLLHISTRDFSFVAEHHMSQIFDAISRHRIKVNMMRNTAISFTVCVTNEKQRLERLVDALSKDFVVNVDEDLELITVRHQGETDILSLVGARNIIFEERIRNTVQLVVRNGRPLQRKS